MNCLEMKNLLFNVRYLCLRPLTNISLCRMRVDTQGKQVLDLLQGKPQLLGALDEVNPPHGFRRKHAISGFGTGRSREKSLTLVISDCLKIDSAALRQLAYGQAVHESTVNPVLRYRVKREMRKISECLFFREGPSVGERRRSWCVGRNALGRETGWHKKTEPGFQAPSRLQGCISNHPFAAQ